MEDMVVNDMKSAVYTEINAIIKMQTLFQILSNLFSCFMKIPDYVLSLSIKILCVKSFALYHMIITLILIHSYI